MPDNLKASARAKQAVVAGQMQFFASFIQHNLSLCIYDSTIEKIIFLPAST